MINGQVPKEATKATCLGVTIYKKTVLGIEITLGGDKKKQKKKKQKKKKKNILLPAKEPLSMPEYASKLWDPSTKGGIKKVEFVKRRAVPKEATKATCLGVTIYKKQFWEITLGGDKKKKKKKKNNQTFSFLQRNLSACQSTLPNYGTHLLRAA